MTPSSLDAILARALAEPAFADQLFADPETALADYSLSKEEQEALRSMSREEFRSGGALDAELLNNEPLSEEKLGSMAGGVSQPLGQRSTQHNEAILGLQALPEPASMLHPDRTLP